MTEYLLDTDTASKLMRGERAAITAMRRARAQQIAISSVTFSELLYGAHLSADSERMAKARRFADRITICDWDAGAAEAHSRVRAATRRRGRAAGVFDLMIASHALSLGMTLVTSDKAISNLAIEGLRIVEW